MSTALEQREAAARPAVPFDDRLWPVLAALLGLALLGGAAIWRASSFDDSRWWANGWTYEAALAGVTVLLIVGVSLFGRSRRSLQLAAVLSLLAHILLFLSLDRYRLVTLADSTMPVYEQSKRVEESRAPDYHVRAPESPAEDFEIPVTTETPHEPLEELDRQHAQELKETPLQSQPTPLPGEAPDVQPQVIPLQKLEEAAPRLAIDSGELSRTEPSAVELAEPEPVAIPELETAAELEAPAPLETAEAATEITPPHAELSTPQQALARLPIEPMPSSADSPQRLEESSLGPQVPSLPGPLTMRAVETPQVRAPQVADLPRAQSGSAEVLDDPQPLVPAPIRSGSGVTTPREVGTLQDLSEQRVAIRPSAPFSPALSPRVASQGESSGTSANAPARMPAAESNRLSKSVASANPAARLPSLAELGPSEGEAASRTPAAATPAPAVAAIEPSREAGLVHLPVRVPAPTKLGGLSDSPLPELGTPSRRASEESQLVEAAPGRLLARKSGGPLTIDGRSREPAEAFARRGGSRPTPAAADARMAERTEAAIELGLVFLAKHQRPDGSWSLHFAPDAGVPDPPPQFRAETAATGLALLSFLGAGYDHYGGPYADIVQRALDDLIRHQTAGGDLYRPEDSQANRSAWLYSHGIATIALCEAYGMTGDPALREPAQKAVDFIIASQDPQRGAWRYVPRDGSDTSVSGWQLMALKSGELAGLQVAPAAYERVRQWLDGAQAPGSQYVYNPQAPNTPQQRHGRVPTPAMTAVGLLMRLYTGLDRDDVHLVEGAEYLLGRLPQDGTPRDPARDTYYWYYATQVMFHMRGKYWNEWNGRLHPLLVDSQQQSGTLAGSWDPRRPVPDRWGPQAGRIYVTTLNLLSLEVYYRHLPLYDSTAK